MIMITQYSSFHFIYLFYCLFYRIIYLTVITISSLMHIQASPLHHTPHTRGLSRMKRYADTQPRDEIVLRETIEINSENFETRVDQLAETIKQMFRDSAASESHRSGGRGSDGGGLFRDKQALDGPISVMLETYVISQQIRASEELAENSERRDHHTRLQSAMIAAGKK